MGFQFKKTADKSAAFIHKSYLLSRAVASTVGAAVLTAFF
jgi:hypothetical protein